MAWETRGNNSYFYQKERIGDKVKSAYIGSGEVAALIDRCGRLWRHEKNLEKADEIYRRDLSEKTDEKLNELSELNLCLVDALFLINGFHLHKRQWRKKRNGNRS